ncbi:pantoate--beta-alanine ligase [Hydrogenovibrio sp. JE_KL2]|uniref:pantoate--beta-alanine ligase n=1 Tax=Hydrogenovibrio sp. JE_KL2 TaxID=2651188 RepID=UPI00128E2584|nr:pantoate--beta-alanine ligase [Hydrogenovibrio sp. JE_KL2]MPQ76912.1 pantoate--beta-alanine ligase [Hydrogenovibrio sp. JE_KL2]
MLKVETIKSVREQVAQWKQEGLKVGFVPTMGNLHDGHLSLVKMAQEKADKVVVSIFVNPLQFGPNEDFGNYPRTLQKDCEKLGALNVDMVFFPSVEEMYPENGMDTLVKASATLGALWEGASRPGHFDGVTTVVTKLFNIVTPDVAVFGQKDFQQWRIIKQMVVDLSMSVDILRAPIGRDIDGLALSSRNQYLTEVQRQVAPKLFVTLQDIASAIESGNTLYRELEVTAEKQLLAYGFDAVDYIRIVDADTLKPVMEKNGSLVVLAVVRLGATRLLDNICIN